MGAGNEAELKAKSIEMATEQATFMGILKSTGIGIIMYAVIGLIVAAVTKKKPPRVPVSHLDLSLVIPLYNEEESLAELHAWI